MLSVGTHYAAAAEPAKQSAKQKQIALGSELFSREWIPNDSRSHSGDGLGPMYNESSCVACHNLGGPGGAGPVSKNVDIITAFSNRQRMGRRVQAPTLPEAIVRALFGGLTEPKVKEPVKKKSREQLLAERKKALAEQKERNRKELVKIHPGFQTTRSVVLHRFATESGYQRWRSRLAQGGFMHINSVAFASPALEDGLVLEAPQPALEPVAEETAATDRPVAVERRLVVDQVAVPQPAPADVCCARAGYRNNAGPALRTNRLLAYEPTAHAGANGA